MVLRKQAASMNSTADLIGNSTLWFSFVKERQLKMTKKKEKFKPLLSFAQKKKTYVRIDKDIRTPSLWEKSKSRAAQFGKILDSLNQSHS